MPLVRNPIAPTVPIIGGGNIVWMNDITDVYGAGADKLQAILTYNEGDASFVIPQHVVVSFIRGSDLNFWEFTETFGAGDDNDEEGRCVPLDQGSSGFVWKRLGISNNRTLITGTTDLANGTDVCTVVLPTPRSSYEILEVKITNVVDLAPANLYTGYRITKTSAGFSFKMNGDTDSANYKAQWTILSATP